MASAVSNLFIMHSLSPHPYQIQQLHIEGSRPVLTHFDILNVGKVDVKVKGSLGLLNWTVNKIVTFMANVVKNFVVRQLESPIRKLISEQLTNGTITLEGV